jgi:glycosyltransferase involved in cell wall biosynthesis/predicted O-methyltransferase YrrM
MKQKIVFITPHLSTGGMPQYLLKQIESIIHNMDVYCIEWDNVTGGVLVVQRNKISQILGDKLITLGEHKDKLFGILQEIAPDIIHFTEIPEHFIDIKYLDPIFINPHRNYRIVASTHGSKTNPKEIRYHPDCYMLASEWSRQQFEHLGIDIQVWEYVVENQHYDKLDYKKILGFDDDWKHVLMVGLFTPGKNQGEIFTIARQLEKYKIKFHFVGNQAGNFKEYWEPLLETKPNNCIIWGEHENVNDFYKAADLFYFSSILELNPLAIKEALAHKLPCIFRRLDTYLDTYDNNPLVTYINEELNKTKQLILDILNPTFNEIPGWFSYTKLYDAMVESAVDNAVFVEIGSWMGKSTNYLARKIYESNKNINFTTVDTFKGTDTEQLHKNIVNQFAGDMFIEFTDNLVLNNNYENLTVIKDESVNAATTFTNSSIDFIMIDGGHSYEEVTTDLHAWYHKIKPGGVITGDDYGMDMFPGVTEAVDKYFYTQARCDDLTWIIKKPRIQIKHLLTHPTDLRELVSQLSLKQLQRYGMIYEPMVNTPYRDIAPAKNCRRPEHIRPDNQPGELYPGAGLGWITGAHYGCYMAHRQALEAIDTENFDFTLIFEADAFIYTGLEEFVDAVNKACFISMRDNVPYISLANNLSNNKEQVDLMFTKTAHNQDLAHAYLVPNHEKQWYLDRIQDCEWDSADLWYNHIFYHHPRLRYTTNTMYIKQADGYSLLDKHFKYWHTNN